MENLSSSYAPDAYGGITRPRD
jgi:hypothetical protein